MPFPSEYSTASEDFERFLREVQSESMRATRNQAYQMTRAVLHVFRDHLTVRDGLDFAGLLPPVLRAIFVESWRPAGEPPPFPDRAELTRQVLAVREPHNTAPDTVIGDVAAVLRRHVDLSSLDRLLSRLPAGAAEYWAIPVARSPAQPQYEPPNGRGDEASAGENHEDAPIRRR